MTGAGRLYPNRILSVAGDRSGLCYNCPDDLSSPEWSSRCWPFAPFAGAQAPGKEGLIETVLLSPGEVVPAHQHNADVFAYVLDGSIITQLKGGKPQTVHTGEVFYESPTDIHVDSRNASKTQPAKLLVFFVKKIGAPPTVAVAKAAH